MSFNIGLAAIETAVVATVVEQLALETTDDAPTPLAEATSREYRDSHFAVGTFGKFTLVMSPRIPDHDAVWKRLSKAGRVVAFNLSENDGSNWLHIYEAGKQVVKRDEANHRAWKKTHPLENRTRPTDRKPTYIAKVFHALTGVKLDGEARDVLMRMHTRPHRIDDAKVEELIATIQNKLDEPFPAEDFEYRDLAWFNRRDTLLCTLDRVWALDEATATTWVPTILAEADRWPADQRELHRDRFDRIVAGKETALDTLLAPAFHGFELSSQPFHYRDKGFGRFVAHPIARELRWLRLDTWKIPTAAAVRLASAPFPDLEYLSLDSASLGDAGVVALAGAAFPALRRLNVRACGMDRDGLRALGASSFAHALEHLAIGGVGIEPELLAPFANLHELSLRFDRTVDAPAMRALLASAHLPALRTLDLYNTAVDAAQAAELTTLRPGLVIHTEYTPSP